ncbi:MAG: radical SAM family heme chaperone HemW [Pseudomonadota bacterium]
MLLYIHVPFCRQKCRYCAFHSVPLLREDGKGLIENYHKALLQEMELWAERVEAKTSGKTPITSIFFGGGTPSLLDPKHMGSIIENAAKHFDVHPDAEITMEANPESLGNKARCRDFLQAGINRLSLGVQSLDDSLLKLVGRPHTAAEAILAYATARNAGFENISLDFIWGLPSQTTSQWLQQVRAIIELGPEHLSAYGLTLEDGTPLKAMCEAQDQLVGKAETQGDTRLTLADEASQEAMFVQGSELLRSAGYEHYEISNFAQEDCHCRHNLGYWSGEDYLGLGPAAVSAFYEIGSHKTGQRRTNPYDHQAWAKAIEADLHAQTVYDASFAGDIEELTPDIMAEEYIMLALRTSRGIVFTEYTAHTGHDFMAQHKDLVHALCAQGLAIIDERHFTLTTQGMLASNEIVERFF